MGRHRQENQKTIPINILILLIVGVSHVRPNKDTLRDRLRCGGSKFDDQNPTSVALFWMNVSNMARSTSNPMFVYL